jgi:hypothetical protein
MFSSLKKKKESLRNGNRLCRVRSNRKLINVIIHTLYYTTIMLFACSEIVIKHLAVWQFTPSIIRSENRTFRIGKQSVMGSDMSYNIYSTFSFILLLTFYLHL